MDILENRPNLEDITVGTGGVRISFSGTEKTIPIFGRQVHYFDPLDMVRIILKKSPPSPDHSQKKRLVSIGNGVYEDYDSDTGERSDLYIYNASKIFPVSAFQREVYDSKRYSKLNHYTISYSTWQLLGGKIPSGTIRFLSSEGEL